MRLLLRLFLLLLLALPLLAAGLVYLAIDDTAVVQGQATLTPAHVERARRLLARHDPRTMRAGVLRSIVVSEADLDLAVNYLLGRYAKGASRIVLHDGTISVRASLNLPVNPIGRFINLDLSMRESDGLPRIDALRLGRVPVPGFVGNWLLQRGLNRLQQREQLAAAADVIRQVRSRDGFLMVDFEWNEATPGRLQAALVGQEERARWRVYQERLVALAAQPAVGRVLSLDRLLGPLLQLAQERSGAGGDAAQESRSALIVLAFYVNGKGLSALVPQARDWPMAKRHVVTLAGRTDLTQHFTISAALAATAGSPLSDVVGLYKELDDARGGSGFSFIDLAADRAGTRLGALAVSGATGQSRLRKAVATGLQESDLIPEVRDLPEFMRQDAFERRFGGVGQPRYQAMVQRIEQRLAALPLYR